MVSLHMIPSCVHQAHWSRVYTSFSKYSDSIQQRIMPELRMSFIMKAPSRGVFNKYVVHFHRKFECATRFHPVLWGDDVLLPKLIRSTEPNSLYSISIAIFKTKD